LTLDDASRYADGVGAMQRRHARHERRRAMTDVNVFETIGTVSEQALDTVVGAVTSPVETAVSARDEARRRGAEVTERAAEQIEEIVDEAMALPERLVVAYLRRLRAEARREDVIGVASRRILGAVHGPAHVAAGFFARIEQESTTGRRRRGRGRPSASSGAGRGRGTRKAASTKSPTRKRAQVS